MKSLKFLVFVLAVVCAVFVSAKSKKKEDPKQCEVCIANLEAIDTFLTGDEKRNKEAIREAIGKRCTKSGFGSEWKPNPNLGPKDVKMCYYFEPIKDSITTLYAMGMPKEKVCKRLMKDNPEICEVKYRMQYTLLNTILNLLQLSK